ncbi:MAG: ABC transporter permease [Candidatus Buchananbacteria bacterium]|nr:ABC transporter permease [Candidatus Buchananbacteria bacterium]
MNKFLTQLQLPLRIAWHSLRTQIGRTLLTILGVVIGIAAVIIVMSAGESIKGLVLGELEAFGSNTIQVEPKVPSTGRNSTDNAGAMAQGIQITTLTLDDAEAIAELPNVTRYNGGLMSQDVLTFAGENEITNFIGASASFIEIDQSEIATGRFYSEIEDDSLARVVVLGSKLATKLFGDVDPIGKSIRIGSTRLEVIGVLVPRGAGFGLDFDTIAYIPLQTVQKLMLGVDHLQWITVEVADAAIQDQTAAAIADLVRERHDITDPIDDDFGVTTMAEARELITTVFGGITLLLVAVAAISLIVGGVGIMNIMYVSVSERTFEIGLRKAIGAQRRQILWQFLFEAILLTFFGGVIGILVGIALTLAVTGIASLAGFSWDFSLPPSALIISFGFCVTVGVTFGYYPARRAAHLDPIEALRTE